MGGTRNQGVHPAAQRGAEPDRAAPDGVDACGADRHGAEPAWVDAHVHIFPPEIVEERESYRARDQRFAALYGDPRAGMATAEHVVAEMDRTGVATSVVFGFPFRDQGLCREVNDYVLGAVAAWPERLAGLACVSPSEPGATAELGRCLEAGMRGSGELAPGDSSDDIDGLKKVAGLLRERGLALLLHSNEPVGHVYPGKSGFGPAACVACAAAYPGLKIVFAHMGGGVFLYEAMPELRKTLADAYYDTAALPYLYDAGIYRAVEATAGAHKLLFGSDYALLSPARYRAGLSELSPAARAAICCNNARKVFEL